MLSMEEQGRLLDMAFDPIFARALPDRTITYWNAGAERVYGWTREEAVGRVTNELLATEYPRPLDEIEAEIEAAGTWEGDLVHQSKDGRRLVVASRWSLCSREGSLPDLILETNHDITSRLDAQRQLGETDELFGLLVSSVQEYAIFLLDPAGHVLTWNEGARRIMQYASEEILGRHFSVFFAEDEVRLGHPERELEMACRDGQYAEEGWRLRKDGSRFWASVLLTALRDAYGELRGFARIVRDLTDKHLEAQRLSELERVKSGVLQLASHELRGPLGTMYAYVSMLQEGALSNAGLQAKAYGLLEAKVREMSGLVNQMLEAARLEEGRTQLVLEPLDLREPVRKAYEDVRLLAPPSHELQLQEPREPVPVKGDELRLVAIVRHLLDNAIKYSPDGGSVRCRVEAADDQATVEVSDQGLGIGSADLFTLFTRFGRIVNCGNSHIAGVGLGLHLTQALAQMHGGKVSVESKPGRGSTFTLSLPRA